MKFRSLLERLLHNWPAKILSLAAAIVLFIVYRMSTLEERFFSVPLVVQANGDLVPASDLPRMVRVTLRGESNSIYPVLEDDIEAWLDLSAISEQGPSRAQVRVRKKGTAVGIDPLEIHVEPAEISLEMEYRDERMIAVMPSFRGYVETGWELSSWSVEPSMATVSGPASRVARIESLSTELVELGGRKEDFVQRIRLIDSDPLVKISGEGVVSFTGRIQEANLVRDFERLPISALSVDEKFIAIVQPSVASMRLQGPWPRLESWEAQSRTLSVDCSGLVRPGEYALSLEASFPPFASLLRLDPPEVIVTLLLRDQDEELR